MATVCMLDRGTTPVQTGCMQHPSAVSWRDNCDSHVHAVMNLPVGVNSYICPSTGHGNGVPPQCIIEMLNALRGSSDIALTPSKAAMFYTGARPFDPMYELPMKM